MCLPHHQRCAMMRHGKKEYADEANDAGGLSAGAELLEQEALQITMHKQALIKQEYELKILIIAHYGENVYNEMIMERIRLKKEREKKEREHYLRQQAFMLNVKYGTGIAFLLTALAGIVYYIIASIQK